MLPLVSLWTNPMNWEPGTLVQHPITLTTSYGLSSLDWSYKAVLQRPWTLKRSNPPIGIPPTSHPPPSLSKYSISLSRTSFVPSPALPPLTRRTWICWCCFPPPGTCTHQARRWGSAPLIPLETAPVTRIFLPLPQQPLAPPRRGKCGKACPAEPVDYIGLCIRSCIRLCISLCIGLYGIL